jgi:signal transduction histidine kinase/ActR/RegA family two-component response regulator
MKSDIFITYLREDLLFNILNYSEDIGKCAAHITSQIREIIGVRVVALFERLPDGDLQMAGACPDRKKNVFDDEAVGVLLKQVSILKEPSLIRPGEGETGRLLSGLGMAESFVVPLIAGDDHLGFLLLLDIMDSRGTEKILKTLSEISGLLSLILKNSFLFRNLENLVEQRTKEREKLQNELAQASKMESVGRLAGGVAHDFNNMLGVILGHVEMALEQVDTDGPLYDDLEEIQKAAQRSVDLTRQLLTFARKQIISPKVLDLNDTVAGMLKMLQRLIGEDIQLSWRPGHLLWPVNVDPSQIDQILVNLCINSRDAISGVGSISIETRNAVITEDDGEQRPELTAGEYCLLEVKDNGSGISPEDIVTIFEPFFTTKPMGKGTGLGLATVYGIVKQNRGCVTVDSRPGKETVFKIFLPRFSDSRPLEALKSNGALLVGGKETILLVEDDPSILKMAEIMIRRLGYNVLCAPTPSEAIRYASEYHGEIHLLITDVIMPEMSGRDLASRLLEQKPDLRLLFMSGYTADLINPHGVLSEGIQFIQKPFSKSDLAASIRKAIDHHHETVLNVTR